MNRFIGLPVQNSVLSICDVVGGQIGKEGESKRGQLRERERCNRTLKRIGGKKSGEKRRRGAKKVMRMEDGQSLGKRLAVHHDRNKRNRGDDVHSLKS